MGGRELERGGDRSRGHHGLEDVPAGLPPGPAPAEVAPTRR